MWVLHLIYVNFSISLNKKHFIQGSASKFKAEAMASIIFLKSEKESKGRN